MELLTSMGISGGIILIGATLIILATQYFNSTSQKYLLEAELSRTGLLIKGYFSQAIDLRYQNRCPQFTGGYSVNKQELLSDQAGVANGGILFNCQGPFPSKSAYELYHVAIFAREMGIGGNPDPSIPQGLWPVAASITFQPPKAPNPSALGTENFYSRSGLLMFRDDGPQMASPLNTGSYSAGTNFNLSPTLEPSQTVARLVKFSVSNIKVIDPTTKIVSPATLIGNADDGKFVVSADFNYTMRSFLGGNPDDWLWCWETTDQSKPSPPTDRCANVNGLRGVAYRDYNRSVRVAFRNNRIYVNPNLATRIPAIEDRRRLMGFIYFFKPY